ncbi:response regulator [Pseudomonas sp. AU10]|uniref:response regulator n=1 Tax=Pseudomonas sp. AU10 TaxID=882697 RepID=UPI0021E32B3A|nr:response regulator [Pseudomonas sp. AU10]MCV2228097.1 response regulator [Pseudomonas sp. AU10]
MREMNVVIADDHPIVLVGVREIVRRDSRYSLVGEAVSSSQLIEQLRKHRPQVLITDFNMPDDDTYGDGLKLIEYILRHFSETKVLVLTMVSNKLILNRLYEIGVAGVIQKSQLHGELEKVLDAFSVENTDHASAVTPSPQNTISVQERFGNLSPREMEVLRLFVTGLSVKKIAMILSRSNKTISAQKISAMRKLGLSSDQQLLTYCIETGQFQ